VSSLFLLFRIGDKRFAMSTTPVVEILPALVWTSLPQSPRGVAGVFGYRGQHVPLIDISELTSGTPATIRMSTRIVLVRHRQSERLLGLLAEHVTETFRASEDDLLNSGITLASAPYLGRVIQRPEGIVQHLDVDLLLQTEFGEGVLALKSDVHR